MRPSADRFGLSCALITPVDASGRIDEGRLVMHSRRVLAEGCSSVTLFGTTGEGASFGLRAREAAFDALVRGGLDFSKQVLGSVAAASAEEAAAQANQAFDAGARGLLLAPPFYFKGVSDEGLYGWFSRVLDTCTDAKGVFLYHIPSVTAVPLSIALIGRLARAYPGVIVGVKDSGGEWPYTQALLEAHGATLHILVGDERYLARSIREGGSGAINGFSNFCAPLLAPLIERGEESPAINAMVDALLAFPVTPGIKALVAYLTGDPEYLHAAPPLRALDEPQRSRLIERWQALAPRQGL